MKRNFCRKNFIYIFCALMCVITGSIFAVLTNKQAVNAQQVYTSTETASTDIDYIEELATNSLTSTGDVNADYYSLTDYNMFFIENQMTHGTCWIFAGITALESYLQKTTGILYDFSEAWLSVCERVEDSTYQLGGGGNFLDFYTLISKYGLLFEEEFPYDYLYNIDETNYLEIYNNYKNSTHHQFTQNLDKLYFLNSSLKSIKQYLVNYGAMSISYNADQTVTNAGKKYSYYSYSCLSSNHAITLIGWDDNASFVDNSGKTHTGAYIGFNSWGTQAGNNGDAEIVYLAYDSNWITGTIFGFKQKSKVNDFTFNIISSNASIDNYEIGKYDQSTTTLDSGKYQDKNVFYYGENIDIDYSYQINNQKTATVSAKITKDGADVSNLFVRHFLNNSQKRFEIETNEPIDSGRYFVEFSVDISSNGVYEETYYSSFTVLSGAEMCYVNPSAIGSEYELYTWQSFNKINSVENINYVYGYSFGTVTITEFQVSNFSQITQIILDDPSNEIRHSASSFISADDSSYSKNTSYIQIYLGSAKQSYELSITFKTVQGHSVVFHIIIYTLDPTKDAKTFVFYEFNGGVRTPDFANYIATGSNYNYTLAEPTNAVGDEYEFSGWFVDKALSQTVGIDINSKAKKRNLTNYAENAYKNNSRYVRKYLYVYAKWERTPFYIEGANLGEKQYGDTVKFELNLAKNGSGNYNYFVANSTLPSGLSLVNENGKYYLVGDLIVRGNYSIEFNCKDLTTNEQISATYTLTVSKRQLGYLIQNKTSVFGEPLEQLTCTLYKGTIYGNDELNINLVCSVSDDSPIGEYTIYGTYINENYDVSFINGTYKITNKLINYTINNYDSTFDGQAHTISLDVSQNQDNVVVEYSLDGTNYQAEPIYETNFTNGKKTIYIRLFCLNYEEENLTAYINIEKRGVLISWTDGLFTYNGQEQAPIPTGDNIVDNSVLTVSGKGTNAGNYVAEVSINSNNYELLNNTKSFVIKKAKPDVSLSSKDVVYDSSKVKTGTEISKISLPKGYEWAEPNQKLKEGANVYYARFVPEDTQNYEIIENIAITLNISDNVAKTEIVKYAVIALCGGIILIIIISIITTISRKAYERSCLDNHTEHSDSKVSKEDQVTIYFVTNAPMTVAPIKSLKRISIDLPNLERNYYEFAGWYTDKLFINKYVNNGTEKVITLYAKWQPKIYK